MAATTPSLSPTVAVCMRGGPQGSAGKCVCVCVYVSVCALCFVFFIALFSLFAVFLLTLYAALFSLHCIPPHCAGLDSRLGLMDGRKKQLVPQEITHFRTNPVEEVTAGDFHTLAKCRDG